MEKNQPRIAKLFKTALLGLATVVLATACNKTTEPPIRPDETAKYNISGQVLGNNLENSDLTALAGVTVSYKFGSVSDETTTDANGYFSFEGLVSAGRYDLTFSLGGYNTTYYSLEFPTLRGTIIDYQLKITMVKLPAGMTTVDPGGRRHGSRDRRGDGSTDGQSEYDGQGCVGQGRGRGNQYHGHSRERPS